MAGLMVIGIIKVFAGEQLVSAAFEAGRTLGAQETSALMLKGAALVGFNFGGNFALFPSATADFFGAKISGANYGWVFTSYGIAGVVGIAAGNFEKVLTGSYAAAFTLAAVLGLLSAGLGGLSENALSPQLFVVLKK